MPPSNIQSNVKQWEIGPHLSAARNKGSRKMVLLQARLELLYKCSVAAGQQPVQDLLV